jgi:hypothetical protein
MAALKGVAWRTLVLLGVLTGLNVLVDPLDVHGTRLVEPIVLGTRQTKLQLYRALRPRPEIVVLGSSRAFRVDPAYVEEKTGKAAFNAAVHAGSPRDFLAFARCMARDGAFPRTVVVGLGLEHFKVPSPPAERRDPLAACGADTDERGWTWSSARPSFLTVEETWASLRVLGMEVTGRPQALYSDVRADGLLEPRGTKPLEAALAESLAGTWSPAFLASYASLDPTCLEEFRRFLEVCRAQHSRVIVYLTPFHPDALARYRAESRFVALRQQLLDQLAAWSKDFPVVSRDLTDIASFGGRPESFTDASHPDAEGDRRVVDALLPDLRE